MLKLSDQLLFNSRKFWKKKKRKKIERKHVRDSEEVAKKERLKKMEGKSRYRWMEIIQELKTGRLLTDQILKIIKIYNAVTFFKVHEFFSLCSEQPWGFLQLDVQRIIMKKVRVNSF